MKILKYTISLVLLSLLVSTAMFAGNPDRQGESGASELLLNPWARSAGLHGLNTSTITGIESMRLNIAGLSRNTSRELVIANTRLYEGSDVRLNALGFGNRIGENGAFGISIMSVDFGDIPVTTTARPEGTGATFSPSFFHMGLGYSHMYANKISVGFLIRGISESLSDISAFGFAVDAGVQYVSGERDNFRLGISLRNIGSPMNFSGEGLAFQADTDAGFILTASQRAAEFELPSLLNIGVSYDYYIEELIIRGIGNFTSNAFSRDQIGGGIELIFNNMITLRGAYKKEIGETGSIQDNLYSGLAGGASVELPFSKEGASRIGFDYGYRATNPFRGTHNFSIRLIF